MFQWFEQNSQRICFILPPFVNICNEGSDGQSFFCHELTASGMYSVLVLSNQTDFLGCFLSLSMSLQVCNAGIDNILGLKWDNSTIWVTNKAWVSVVSWVSIGSWVSISICARTIGVCAIGTIESAIVSIIEGESLGSEVSSLGSEDLWGLGHTLDTIRVDNSVGAGNSSRGKDGSQELHG